MFNYFVRIPITYTLERIRGTGIFCCLFIQCFIIIVNRAEPEPTHDRTASVFNLTNRAKEAFRLVHSICQVESVYVCGFACVRMCMVCWILTLGMAVVC